MIVFYPKSLYGMIWAGLPASLSRKHVNKNKFFAKTDLNPCNFDQNTLISFTV